jgi:hypothetical protein
MHEEDSYMQGWQLFLGPHTFPVSGKKHWPSCPIPLTFLYVVELVHILNVNELFAAER